MGILWSLNIGVRHSISSNVNPPQKASSLPLQLYLNSVYLVFWWCRCGEGSIKEEEYTNLSLDLMPGKGSIDQMLANYLKVRHTFPAHWQNVIRSCLRHMSIPEPMLMLACVGISSCFNVMLIQYRSVSKFVPCLSAGDGVGVQV